MGSCKTILSMVDTASKTGFISQIIGPVVDVEFPGGELPTVYSAIIVGEGESSVTCEVQQLLGSNKVRAVSMTSTDGLKRGAAVVNTGAPITVPVGVPTLGRIFNVLGEPVDEMGPCEATAGLPIHRAAPAFTDLDTKPSVFETGIKVVDLLAPYKRGGKIGVFGGVGERTREGNDLYAEMKESGVIDEKKLDNSKVALVYGQMNEPPGARMRVGLTALTMAEYFRDVNKQDVLLFIDNIFRFVQAGAEVSALLGRRPSAVGCQPTLATEMGGLL